MKQFLQVVAGLLVVAPALCQPATNSVIETFRKDDNIAEFIYHSLDLFLADPSEENMKALEISETKWWRPLRSKDEHLAHVILLCNKGYYLAQFSKVYESVDAYEKAWKIYRDRQLTGFDIIEYCLKPLGNNYSMLGDYQSAANIIKNYLFIAEKEGNPAHIISAVINLSIVYHDTGRQQETIDLLTNALHVKGIEDNKKGVIYSNLARNYVDLNNFTDAENAARLAFRYLKKDETGTAAVYGVNTHKTMSLIHLQRGDQKMALHHIDQARHVVNEHRGVFKPRELAKLENDYAALLKLQGQYNDARQSYQRAFEILLPRYKAKHENDLPDRSLFYAENTIKETLDGFADLLIQKGNPQQALECLERSFVVEHLLRKTYNYQEAGLQQQHENRNRAELAISLLYDLFTQTKDRRFVTKAFQIAELTKAVVLRDAIEAGLRNQAMKHNLLKKEQALSYNKARIDNQLVLEQMKGEAANVNNINNLLSEQTALSIDIKALRKEMGTTYPQYDFDGESSAIDITRLQQKLKLEDATLVEFFAGTEFLYLFTVNQNLLSMHRVAESKRAYDAVRAFNGLFETATAINSNVELYKATALQLHDLLHIPKEAHTRNLLIVPDGLLNYTPFEALLSEKSKAANYEQLPYLIKKFVVTYRPSASLYAIDTARVQKSAEKKLLAMFPVFENTHRVLTHSRREAEDMQTYLQGKYIFEGGATKRAFGENLGHYNIIHLSTHADAGTPPEPPSITFFDSTLYLPEVYGLQLQPDLLVLSACETGTGKLSKGEGALSLARGFQYAGARNMIFSLWKVNDQSTALLMSSFYRHYSNDRPKSLSLQQAKLDYLANPDLSNARKSPYYWAAFVYYGVPDEASTTVSTGWYVLSVVAVLLMVIAVAYLRKTRRVRKESAEARS